MRGERGSAVPFAVACLGAVLMLGAALAVGSAMVVDHRRAQAAADLSALAGARAMASGGDACADARRIAEGNGASLATCRLEDRAVRVRVVVLGPRWLRSHGDLAAVARAGYG